MQTGSDWREVWCCRAPCSLNSKLLSRTSRGKGPHHHNCHHYHKQRYHQHFFRNRHDSFGCWVCGYLLPLLPYLDSPVLQVMAETLRKQRPNLDRAARRKTPAGTKHPIGRWVPRTLTKQLQAHSGPQPLKKQAHKVLNAKGPHPFSPSSPSLPPRVPEASA